MTDSRAGRERDRILRRRYRARKFIVYLQPFTNTYALLENLVPLYESALAHRTVVGLAVGTRRDCVDEAKIAWFQQLARCRSCRRRACR